MGRDKIFRSEEDLLYFFLEYLDECKEQNITPNKAGFAAKCFMTKRTLNNYNVDTHPFFPTMQLILTFLEDRYVNSTSMSDKFKEFMLKNNFPEDYRDKQEIVSENYNHNDDLTKLTSDELKQKAQQLIDKLNINTKTIE